MAKINTDYGAQALDLNQLLNHQDGTGIVSGCTPSVGTNAMEVDVASGTARVNGTNYSITASTILLDSANADYPRKDLVVVDNTGSVTKITGTAEEAKPAGSTRRNTRRPRPSDISGSDVAVITEVWVGAGASDIVSGDISDRRLIPLVEGFLDVDGDDVAELQNAHADFGGGDARNVGALDANAASIGKITSGANNVIKVRPGEDINQAITDAVGGIADTGAVDTVHILPGEHHTADSNGTITLNKRLNIIWDGQLVKDSDVTGFHLTPDGRHSHIEVRSKWPLLGLGQSTGTTPGVVFEGVCTQTGPLIPRSVGGNAVEVLQATSNLNGTSLQVGAEKAGGVGVKIYDDGSDSKTDLNGMTIDIPYVLDTTGNGVEVDGFWNQVTIGYIENCGANGLKILDNWDSGKVEIGRVEACTADDILISANATYGGVHFGDTGGTRTNNSTNVSLAAFHQL